MSWLPLGPDFVFAPRDASFKRLSRRNELGRQALVSCVAIDPTDANCIYIVIRPSSGGATVFRTRDGGNSWTPIFDELHQTIDPTLDPVWIAVNPDHPETIYVACFWNACVFVSNNRGEPGSWSPRRTIGAFAFTKRLVIDSRTSANVSTTEIYAATTAGLFRSTDGGTTWGATPVVAGDIASFVAHTPATGNAQFYATVGTAGVFRATNNPGASAGWTNLTAAGIGLPATTSFDYLLVDHCPRNPNCAYVWHFKAGATTGLYRTTSPTTSWTQVTMTTTPNPWYGYYALSFAVAPNSPGDGLNDVIVFGDGVVERSIDGGRNWVGDHTLFHVDQHAITFFPAQPSVGTIPVTYIGCDGGIAKSTKWADPSVNTNIAPAHHNEGNSLVDGYGWQNLNHGLHSVAMYSYATVRDAPALGYVGCQDTGVAGGASLGWRGIADADGGGVAAAPAPDGVSVWGPRGMWAGWPSFRLERWRDTGDLASPSGWCMLGGSLLVGTSNLEVGLDNKCVAGVVARDSSSTLSAAVTASTTPQSVTPASMSNIIVGSRAVIDAGTMNEETVTVTAVTATTFTAVFTKAHGMGASITLERGMVVRIDHAGAATRISQDFTPEGNVTWVAVDSSNADNLWCKTGNHEVWRTTSGSTAGPTTVWTRMNAGRPAGTTAISSICVSAGGDAFVMFSSAITIGPVTSPLFRVSGGGWTQQTCSGLPAVGFGHLVADAILPTELYVASGGRIWWLRETGPGVWNWTEISAGLPGPGIWNLAAVKAGGVSLLRAAVTNRGIWEKRTGLTPAPAIKLYLRDHALDTGWQMPSADGIVNPLRPAERLWHYQCEDVKLDARQNAPMGQSPFYQTDPEASPLPPLDHVRFDQLRDNSLSLPQSDPAWLHVQVHNHSMMPSGPVQVWAIYARVSAGVPSLSASPSQGNAFPFWSQFAANGTITPNLPADSPWSSVGAPVTLNGIAAPLPKVASWNWVVPTLSSGATGHYCVAVFIHASNGPVGETTRTSVDDITPTNFQVGQKNLHVGPPLPPSPGPGSESEGGAGGRPAGRRDGWFEYIELHSAGKAHTRSQLRLDLRTLPKELQVSFLLTRLETEKALDQSTRGVRHVREATSDDYPPWLRKRTLLELLPGALLKVLGWVRELFGGRRKPIARADLLSKLRPVVYEAERSALVEIEGIRLPEFGFAGMLLRIQNMGTMESGTRHRFEVQQLMTLSGRENVLIGGSTFVVVIAGDSHAPEPKLPPTHDVDADREERERAEREGEKQRWVPDWMRDQVKRGEREREHNWNEKDENNR